MEVYESVAWIAIGFIPTLLAMEVASKVAKGFKTYSRKKIAMGINASGGR
jgi:hypothetical protein